MLLVCKEFMSVHVYKEKKRVDQPNLNALRMCICICIVYMVILPVVVLKGVKTAAGIPLILICCKETMVQMPVPNCNEQNSYDKKNWVT